MNQSTANTITYTIWAFWLFGLILAVVVGWLERREERKLWGRLGVLAAFMFGFAGLTYEVSKVADESEKTTQIVDEIRRVLGRIELIRVSFRISAPMTDGDLYRYHARLVEGADVCFFGSSGDLQSQTVNPLCLPERETEPAAYAALGMVALCLDFFKEPIDPKLYKPCRKNVVSRSSLHTKVIVGYEEGLELEYDAERERFVLQALNQESRPEAWKLGNARGENIASVSDLVGAHLFISFRNLTQGIRVAEGIYKVAEIDSLSLSGTPGLEIDLSNRNMVRGRDGQGLPFYYTYLVADPASGDIYASKTPVAP